MATQKDSLVAYRKRRHFKRTPEPRGTKQASASQSLFVIQKHDASHLHYDVRIEINGVLKSWAVPKGISTKPAEKHLAIPTEDHPLSYAHFEGLIPAGEYGGGTVMVWDIGTYRNIKKVDNKLLSMDRCLKRGRIEVWLDGKKLKGGYALIKTAGMKASTKTPDRRARRVSSDKKTYWLLLKMKDAHAAKPIRNATKSALTGRTMKQIAQESSE